MREDHLIAVEAITGHEQPTIVPMGCHLLDCGDFERQSSINPWAHNSVMIDCERPGARSECGPGVARDEAYGCVTLCHK